MQRKSFPNMMKLLKATRRRSALVKSCDLRRAGGGGKGGIPPDFNRGKRYPPFIASRTLLPLIIILLTCVRKE